MSDTINTLIADDEPSFRDGLRRLIEQQPDLRVVGDAGTVQKVLELARALDPDVLILDPAMDRGRGLGMLRLLAESSRPRLRPIVFAHRLDDSTLIQALCSGARGVVTKDSPRWVLFKAIRSVMNGQLWLSHSDMATVIDVLRRQSPSSLGDAPSPRFKLTQREREVVVSVASGESNRGIAEFFCIREDTVKRHLWNIFNKVGVHSRLELALFALRSGLAAKAPEREPLGQTRSASARPH